jgi:hypothetical protein
MNIASMFSQMMTVPVVMISALFLSSFLENGGDLVFSPASILIITFSVLVADLSTFGLLREYSRHGSISIRSGLVSFPTSATPASTRSSEQNVALRQPSAQGEEWEESSTKEKE